MLFALLLLGAAAADPQTAVEAEHAFNLDAQDGQWDAFRRFAAEDAIIFTPQPANAHEALKDAKNPPIAVQWWPAKSFVACDGSAAVNTGPWVRPTSLGYFSTVWRRGKDGAWKWAVDHGDSLEKPRALPEQPVVRRAACSGKQPVMVPVKRSDAKSADGRSDDGTLRWSWVVLADGSRSLTAMLWNGKTFDTVLFDKVAAPK